jgi:hypothetical protein
MMPLFVAYYQYHYRLCACDSSRSCLIVPLHHDARRRIGHTILVPWQNRVVVEVTFHKTLDLPHPVLVSAPFDLGVDEKTKQGKDECHFLLPVNDRELNRQAAGFHARSSYPFSSPPWQSTNTHNHKERAMRSTVNRQRPKNHHGRKNENRTDTFEI